jgi:hypothetical protein
MERIKGRQSYNNPHCTSSDSMGLQWTLNSKFISHKQAITYPSTNILDTREPDRNKN